MTSGAATDKSRLFFIHYCEVSRSDISDGGMVTTVGVSRFGGYNG